MFSNNPGRLASFTIVGAALAVAVILLAIIFWPVGEEKPTLRMVATTTIEGSGLLEALVSPFEAKTGVSVKYIVVGTGQALRLGADGNADILFLHDPEREEEFMAGGFGAKRVSIMENKFILVGPSMYEEEFAGRPICEIFQFIAEKEIPFASRGDLSGTHYREMELWKKCGDAEIGDWYFETGSGMVATLRVASARNAFTLVDFATWNVHKERMRLIPYVREGDYLRNVYSIIMMSEEKFPEVNVALAESFIDYLLTGEGREIIAKFGTDAFGFPLFQIIEAGQ